MSESKFTPGPWFADTHGRIWRRDPKDLYENGGKVAGDKPLAVVHIGWLGENVQGYPLQANARLIAAAPELLEALEAAVDCGMVPTSSASEGGANKYSEQVRVADQIRAAIAKARGQS